jgi:multicomponent Na+:H+ antiporter subunit E
MAYLDICLRLTIWFLLTADLSLTNIIIGIVVALLIPRSATKPAALRDWLKALWHSLIAIPQAYIEAIEIIIKPHRYEDTTLEHVSPRRTPGLIFLDIFIITFTPKTIVTQYHERGWYSVHWIRRRKPE